MISDRELAATCWPGRRVGNLKEKSRKCSQVADGPVHKGKQEQEHRGKHNLEGEHSCEHSQERCWGFPMSDPLPARKFSVLTVRILFEDCER